MQPYNCALLVCHSALALLLTHMDATPPQKQAVTDVSVALKLFASAKIVSLQLLLSLLQLSTGVQLPP